MFTSALSPINIKYNVKFNKKLPVNVYASAAGTIITPFPSEMIITT